MQTRRRNTVAVALTAALLLTGCTAPTPLSELLERPQTVDDTPTTIDLEETGLVEDSIRFAGQDRYGVAYFVGKNTDQQNCMLAIESEETWIAGCGDGMSTTFGETGVTLTLMSATDDLAPGPDSDDEFEEIGGVIRVER